MIPSAFDSQIALAGGAVRAQTERKEGDAQSSADVHAHFLCMVVRVQTRQPNPSAALMTV